MKRRYERPSAYIEEFTPNEYVAACGEGGTIYKFQCTAGGGKNGDLTDITGTINYTVGGRHKELGTKKYTSYHACNAEHSASSSDTFVRGRYYPNGGYDNLKGKYEEVYIGFEPVSKDWWGNKGYDIHATTNLNPETWETAKS